MFWLSGQGEVRSWLFKIAYNTFLNHKASLRCTESIDEARALVSSTTADAEFEHQDLYLALRTLPPKERSAITLFYLNGYNIKEMDMKKDKAIEDLFFAQKPHFSDNADFMALLTKRMDAIEYLKQHQEATIHRYKMMMVVAFMVGIISGAISIAWILSTPADEPLFTFQVQTGFLLWLAENSRWIAATGLSLLMTMGIISIISNVQDILHMRVCLKA